MSESISDEALAALEAGLEGVTPGPWKHEPKHPMFVGYRHAVYGTGVGDLVIGLEDDKKAALLAAHIARCDPQTIGGLIARLEASEKDRAYWKAAFLGLKELLPTLSDQHPSA